MTQLFLDGLGLSLTNYCDQSCNHCMIDSNSKPRQILPADKAIEVVTYLRQHRILGDGPVMLTGGEIGLHPEIDELIVRLAKLGKVNATTAGSSFLDERIKKLAPHINIASLSIDPIAITNQFRSPEQTVEALRKLTLFRSYGAKNVAIQSVVTSDNLDSIEGLVELASTKGVNHVRLLPLAPFGRAKRLSSSLFLTENGLKKLRIAVMKLNGQFPSMMITSLIDSSRFVKRHPKRYLGIESIRSIEIDPNGDVYPTSLLMTKLKMGNILEEDISSILGRFAAKVLPNYEKIANRCFARVVDEGRREIVNWSTDLILESM